MRIEQGRPAFEQIAQHIADQIDTGELGPGDRIPSERELREQWSTSKMTANRAVAALKAAGLVETRVGSGTAVALDVEPGRVSSSRGHTDRMLREGRIYSDRERSVIYEASVISTGHVSPAILAAAGMPTPVRDLPTETSSIIKRARVMYVDNTMRGVCTTWVPWPLLAQQGPAGQELIERLTSTEHRIPQGTAAALAEVYGVEWTNTIERVGVRPVPIGPARELGFEPGTPMLWTLATRMGNEYVLEVDEWFRTDDVVYHY